MILVTYDFCKLAGTITARKTTPADIVEIILDALIISYGIHIFVHPVIIGEVSDDTALNFGALKENQLCANEELSFSNSFRIKTSRSSRPVVAELLKQYNVSHLWRTAQVCRQVQASSKKTGSFFNLLHGETFKTGIGNQTCEADG